MELTLLFRGLLIGFSIAAPVGPIGVLCIRRTLSEGRAAGLLSGLGAATADAIYGCIAGFGLTVIANFLLAQQAWFSLAGGAFLCYLGVKTWQAQPAQSPALVAESGKPGDGLSTGRRMRSWLGLYASTFVLTLTNPLTILSFVAIFAGLGLAEAKRDIASAGILVMGVFGGSALWWLLLSSSINLLREKFNPQRLQWVNRLSGVIIAGFGLLALWKAFF